MIAGIRVLNDLFDVVVVLAIGRESRIGLWSKQIGVLWVFLDDIKCHFIESMLEFDSEICKNLVFVSTDGHLLPYFPKLLGHPVGDIRNSLYVDEEVIHIAYFLVENSAER